MVLGAVSDYAAVHCGYVGHHCAVEKPLLSVGLNLLLVIPGVLVANTPLWIAYPYCYSGYLVSCSLHDFTAETSDAAFSVFPFLPCAIVVFGLFFALAVTQFGKKEMR